MLTLSEPRRLSCRQRPLASVRARAVDLEPRVGRSPHALWQVGVRLRLAAAGQDRCLEVVPQPPHHHAIRPRSAGERCAHHVDLEHEVFRELLRGEPGEIEVGAQLGAGSASFLQVQGHGGTSARTTGLRAAPSGAGLPALGCSQRTTSVLRRARRGGARRRARLAHRRRGRAAPETGSRSSAAGVGRTLRTVRSGQARHDRHPASRLGRRQNAHIRHPRAHQRADHTDPRGGRCSPTSSQTRSPRSCSGRSSPPPPAARPTTTRRLLDLVVDVLRPYLR